MYTLQTLFGELRILCIHNLLLGILSPPRTSCSACVSFTIATINPSSFTCLENTVASIDVSKCIAVAFNPFFPDNKDYEEEKARLAQKLETGVCNKVYLQFGTDISRLRTALHYLAELQERHPKRFEVCGSVFLPTRKLIAQQKFR